MQTRACRGMSELLLIPARQGAQPALEHCALQVRCAEADRAACARREPSDPRCTLVGIPQHDEGIQLISDHVDRIALRRVEPTGTVDRDQPTTWNHLAVPLHVRPW